MKYVIRPNAKDDILRQFRYYLLEDALDAANSFLDAVDESIGVLRVMPEIGAPKLIKNPVLAGLRSWSVKGFEDILISTLFSLTPCASFAFCMENGTSGKSSDRKRAMKPVSDLFEPTGR